MPESNQGIFYVSYNRNYLLSLEISDLDNIWISIQILDEGNDIIQIMVLQGYGWILFPAHQASGSMP